MSRPWQVHRPGPLVRLDEGLWAVEDVVPGLPGARRRMSIVRRADGGLVFYNAIALPDAQLEELRRFGRPAQLVVPNHLHMLQARAFAEKLGVPVYGPDARLADVQANAPGALGVSSLPADPELEVDAVDGFVTGELALFVRRGERVTLLTCDVVTNQPNAWTPIGLALRLVGFTGPAPRLPKPVRKRVERDRTAVAAQLDRWAEKPGLARLVPSHGDVLEAGVPEALRAIAAAL